LPPVFDTITIDKLQEIALVFRVDEWFCSRQEIGTYDGAKNHWIYFIFGDMICGERCNGHTSGPKGV
jgi:hypothetical protein